MGEDADVAASQPDVIEACTSHTGASPADARGGAQPSWFGRYPMRCNIVALALGLLAAAALSIDLAPVSYEAIEKIQPGATGAVYICYEVLLSFAGHNDSIPLLALALLLVFPIRSVLFSRRDSWRPSVVIPSVLFAGCMVFGMSYDLTDSAALVLGGISQTIKASIMAAGYLVVGHLGFYIFYSFLDWLGAPRYAFSEGRFGFVWRLVHVCLDVRPWLIPAALLLLAWAPSFIAAMPGIFMGDTGAQIRQWFNLPNGTSDYLNLLNPDVLLNGHHPVVHTALIGGCVQTGMALFGSENAGLLLYTTVQFLLTVATVAYILSALRRFGAGLVPRAIVLLFFCTMPLFSNYAVLATKDVLFADAFALLVVQMAVLMCDGRGGVFARTFDVVLFAVGSLGSAFLRNGGVVFSLAACALVLVFAVAERLYPRFRAARVAASSPMVHTEARQGVQHAVSAAAAPSSRAGSRVHGGVASFGVLAITLVLVYAFNSVLMPALDITPGSRREMLSIPFQQTARFVLKHDGAHAGVEGGTDDGLISEEEREVIDRVLGYDTLAARYDPDKSDAVKNGFNEDATSADVAAYLSLWARMFFLDPESYISAAANNYYGYFYPSVRDAWFYSTVESEKIMAREENRAYFDFHPWDAPVVDACGQMVNLYRVAIQRLPLISLTMSSASYTWLLIATGIYVLRKKQWRALALLVPLFGVLAVCLIGPCNGSTYMRYLYPVIVSLPFVLVALLAWPRVIWDATSGSQP